MPISKSINIADFQKCGEIMVAVKRNKFAMACKYCEDIFTQLQAFMRHLQLQHNDNLGFVKQAKEVEVYAVEELMNQTAASCMQDIESEESNLDEEDAKWLSKEDMKWLKEGVEPKKGNENHNKKADEQEVDKDLGLANMSILKALEDCDVSFNLMDDLNSTKCLEDKDEAEQSYLNSTLLREIENDWYDSDSNGSEAKKIDCTNNANYSKQLLNISKQLDLDVTMSETLINSTCKEENIEDRKDNQSIKGLLEDLDDLEDIDSLLENLEGKSKINKKVFNNQMEKDVKVKDEKILEKNKIMLNPKLENKSPKLLENTNNIEFKVLKDFETRLKELEDNLDYDIANNIENIESKTLEVKSNKHKNDFASKLKDLEDSLIDDCPQKAKVREIKENKILSYSGNEIVDDRNDFALQLKNLEDSLIEEVSEITQVKGNHLNEDLTKALADALGDDNLDLLNIPPEEEIEEPLNQDILNLLNQELMGHENDNLLLSSEKQTTNERENLKETNIINSSKKQRNSLISLKNNIKSKYQKTNIKARTKIIETHSKNILKPSLKSLVLKESNSQNSVKKLNSQEIPFKGNHEIFIQQQQINNLNTLLKSPAKTPTSDNSNGKILNSLRQRKTPHKENQENKTPALNIQNIKKEKFTPVANFINTDRGDKTPLKREQMFLKQSPRTQEKLENLIENVTPKRGDKTPQERTIRIKQSPKTQQKQENLNTQQTPNATKQKTPQLKGITTIKQSPKTLEKQKQFPTNKNKTPTTPENNKSPPLSKQQKSKSPAKFPHISNEKCPINPISPPRQQTKTNSNSTNYIEARTPLTTPQRLRNIAIKIQRFTPDKVANKQTTQETKSLEPSPKSLEDDTKQIRKHFKLPRGISLSKVNTQSSSQETNQTEIIETPVKPTYCKQNFSESSLESEQQEDSKKINPTIIDQPSLMQTTNNPKTKNNSTKLRQRKASIDIIPSLSSNPANVQQTKQSSVNKTPRHGNLDYKSYAVNRSARKKEVLQRMRHIKKQIFKSIEGIDGFNKINRMKSPLMKSQRKRKILIENIQILPSLKKESLTPLIQPFNDFKKPTENTTTTSNVINSVSPKNLADDQKQAKIFLDCNKNDSPINDDEKLIKKSLKRPASSPLLNDDKQAKRPYKSPIKEHSLSTEKTSEAETTQLDLSESVVDFLQRDLKANRLNVDSFLNEELPIDDCTPDETSLESNAKDTKIEDKTKDSESTNNSNLINDLLEQVDNEKPKNEMAQKETANEKDEKLNNGDNDIDFDDFKDIQLLSKFGLKIIKYPEIEDSLCLEERDIMNEKAMKFSNIYKNWPRIWSTKNSETPTIKEELNISFRQLLHETNLLFNLDLSLVEIKRLANLISIWYSHNFNNKLIEKRKISESTNRYLLMFHYIPKTTRRFFYCEYCEEYFNTEHKYFTHRIVHTGALYPYKCRKCCTGFKNVKHLNNHEALCDIYIDNKSNKCNLKAVEKSYENTKTRCHKCLVCSEIFASPESLYEHSKQHLKTIYNCVKCDLVFASAIDVQNHMSVCNKVVKYMPKQCTPRPSKLRN